MIQFYCPDIATNPVLPESDSQHCVRVLRKQAGDTVEVIDGRGTRYECRIIDPHPKHTLLEIITAEPVPKPWKNHITVAVAPTKNMDRMEWLVEKLTEIGVDRIVPLLCRHSERKEIKTERLEKIAVSAMKQSLKTTLPEILPMMSLKDFVASSSEQLGSKYVAYCDSNIERRLLARDYQPGEDVTILIGPEGDFSPEEVDMLINNRFIPVSLGDCRLRTETAALMACQTFHVINMLDK